MNIGEGYLGIENEKEKNILAAFYLFFNKNPPDGSRRTLLECVSLQQHVKSNKRIGFGL